MPLVNSQRASHIAALDCNLYAQHLIAPQQIKLKLSLKSTYCFHCLAYTSSSQAQLLLRTVA